MRALAVFVSVLMMLAPARAEEPPVPDLADLAWLEGCWEGPAFGGTAKECWVTGPDGHMTGLFQLEEEGAIVFTEILHLGTFESGPAMRVKHFNRDITGWEEKGDYVEFPLERTEPGLAEFGGLTLRLGEDGQQTVELKMTSRDGSVRTEVMTYARTR